MFDLKRPCKTCPFRKGQGSRFQLRRLSEIRRATSFQCHSTVDYGASDIDDGGDASFPRRAGRSIARASRSSSTGSMSRIQIMRIAERMGALNLLQLSIPRTRPTRLGPTPCALIEGGSHERRRRTPRHHRSAGLRLEQSPSRATRAPDGDGWGAWVRATTERGRRGKE